MPTVRAMLDAMDRALRAAADPARAVHEKSYLKSECTHLGVAVPAIRSIAKSALRANGELTASDRAELVRRLWASSIHERRMIAVEVLVARARDLTPADVGAIEDMLRTAKTWALVDPLATHVVGSIVERYPEALASVLDRWSVDPDFWVRRASLLASLRALRRGEGDFERFARHADAMLDDQEFFIRKAIGWVLRETSKKRPQLVADWLAPRIDRASGITVREAVKYLPERDRLLAQYRARAKRSKA